MVHGTALFPGRTPSLPPRFPQSDFFNFYRGENPPQFLSLLPSESCLGLIANHSICWPCPIAGCRDPESDYQLWRSCNVLYTVQCTLSMHSSSYTVHTFFAHHTIPAILYWQHSIPYVQPTTLTTLECSHLTNLGNRAISQILMHYLRMNKSCRLGPGASSLPPTMQINIIYMHGTYAM